MTPDSWASEGEVEARRPDLEELQVRDDERVAGASEEDPDEGDEQAEPAEHREQDDRRLALARPDRLEVAAVDERDQRRADKHERRHEDAGDGRVEVGEQLLQAKEVPRRLGDGGRDVAV